MLEIDGRDNPRDFSSQSYADNITSGGSSSTSSTVGTNINTNASTIANTSVSIKVGGADLIVKGLLRNIHGLLGFNDNRASASSIMDVVETAKHLSEALERHYGLNSLGRNDSAVDRTVVGHVLGIEKPRLSAFAAPKNNVRASQLSTLAKYSLRVTNDTSDSDVTLRSDSFQSKMEKNVRKYVEMNKDVLLSKVGAKSASASRYANSVSRLFIIVHGLDGPGLR